MQDIEILGGIIIPPSVASNPKLTAAQKLIVGLILALSDRNGICTTSNDTIAELAGLSVSTLSHGVVPACKILDIKITKPRMERLPKFLRQFAIPESLIRETAKYADSYN